MAEMCFTDSNDTDLSMILDMVESDAGTGSIIPVQNHTNDTSAIGTVAANLKIATSIASYENGVDRAEREIRRRLMDVGDNPVGMTLLAGEFREAARQLKQKPGGSCEIVDALLEEAGRLAYMASVVNDTWCCFHKCVKLSEPNPEVLEKCISYRRAWDNRRRCRDAKNKEKSQYCCVKRCFQIPDDQVDGQACNICKCYSFCQCRCRTRMWNEQWAWCCRRRCILLTLYRVCMYQNCNRCNRIVFHHCIQHCQSYSDKCLLYHSESTFLSSSSEEENV